MKRHWVLGGALALGCNADEVSPPVPTETDGGLGDTGDTEGSNPDVCWDDNANADAVRWQCEGLAEVSIFFDADVDVPDLDGTELIRQIIEAGRLDFNELFGPWADESYDDPGIDACCLPDVPQEDDGHEWSEEYDPDPSAEARILQAARACTNDCVDQACRQAPKILRDLADEIPGGLPIVGPSYRQQVNDLANWIAVNHLDCYNALRSDGITQGASKFENGGQWQIPDNDQWPDVTNLTIEGNCGVFEWYLPEAGRPDSCTGINDNNGEEPFGAGTTFGGFDTFAPVGGGMELDGPMILGVHAAGSAPLLTMGDLCPRGECSRVDAWITEDAIELQRIVLTTPSSMEWEQDGMVLTIDDLHVVLEHPRTIPLVSGGQALRFELPPGAVDLLFAGRIHGVPVEVVVPNVTSLVGHTGALPDGGHWLSIDPFAIEHRDDYGTWTMQLDVGDLVAVDHSPRAVFETQPIDGAFHYDASPSWDPDGDPLFFEWYVENTPAGQSQTLVLPEGSSAPTLRVHDLTGRSSWTLGSDAG